MDAAEIVNFLITVAGGRIYTMTATIINFFPYFFFFVSQYFSFIIKSHAYCGKTNKHIKCLHVDGLTSLFLLYEHKKNIGQIHFIK